MGKIVKLGRNRVLILAAIHDARLAGRPPPTIKELMGLTGDKWVNSVARHLAALRRYGLISRGRGHRALKPLFCWIPANQLDSAALETVNS